MESKRISIILLITVLVAGGIYTANNLLNNNVNNLSPTPMPSGSFNQNELEDEMVKLTPAESAARVEIVATNLDIPWDLDFLPDGSILIAERPGTIKLIDRNGKLNPDPIYEIFEVAHVGEGGLLGLAIHPNYSENNFVYFYYTYRSGLEILNKVARYTYISGSFSEERVIVDDIPGSIRHNGGRLDFGPDGFLYITTGDANNPQFSQQTGSLAGKILRVGEGGEIPNDNPFGNEVYSYGHRNPQGLAWDTLGRLWATEHGSSAYDELNLVEKGKNYGWPDIRGSETRIGMETPILHSGNTTWAPSGATQYGSSIFFTGLRGSALYEASPVDIDAGSFRQNLNLKQYFYREYGRLRTIVKGPDGLLYILTSNRDGRGGPASDDDKVIRINPNKL